MDYRRELTKSEINAMYELFIYGIEVNELTNLINKKTTIYEILEKRLLELKEYINREDDDSQKINILDMLQTGEEKYVEEYFEEAKDKIEFILKIVANIDKIQEHINNLPTGKGRNINTVMTSYKGKSNKLNGTNKLKYIETISAQDFFEKVREKMKNEDEESM